MKSILLLLIPPLMFSGCAYFTPLTQHKELDPNKAYWIQYDASRRGAFYAPASTGKILTCAEPAPDIGISLSRKLKGSIKLPDGTDISGLDSSSDITVEELAGRENVVLLAREAMFRLCERQVNDDLDIETYKELYNNVFDKVSEIAVAQAEKARQNAVSATQKAIIATQSTQEAEIRLQQYKMQQSYKKSLDDQERE
ncbi:hypothetical protein [Acinetobacter sp.]|uniref:hypothetical protein n=1 Tax=Acinetobacter sp. TaxID=472 RepID=UPI0028B167F6|nr:hypothetical protein [Acinetobacter sp.]